MLLGLSWPWAAKAPNLDYLYTAKGIFQEALRISGLFAGRGVPPSCRKGVAPQACRTPCFQNSHCALCFLPFSHNCYSRRRETLLLALVSPASQGASGNAKKPLMSPPPGGCRERGSCWNCGSSHGRPWLEQEMGQQLEDSRSYSQKAVVPQTKEPCIPGSPLGHLKTETATEGL